MKRHSYIIAAVIWLALVCLFFAPAIFCNKVLAPLDILGGLFRPWAENAIMDEGLHNGYVSDAISQYLPYNYSVYRNIREDGYIGWNPYASNGTAILDNTMLCPGDWHHELYRILPFWDAWDLGIILQFAIAGLGMIVLLRFIGFSASLSLLGAIGYGLCSPFITWYCHRWILGALCWAPWMLWAYLRAIKNNKWIDLPAVTFTALALRGGHLQACLFIALIIICLLISAVADIAKTRKVYPDEKPAKRTIRPLLFFTTTCMLATFLSLDVWLRTIPSYILGCPPRTSIGWIAALMKAPVFLSAFDPFIFGTPQSVNLLAALKADLFFVIFFGSLLALMGLVGFCKRDTPLLPKLLLICGSILALTPLQTWLYLRVEPLFALGAIWLAIWILREWSDEPRHDKFWKRVLWAFGIVVILWLLASIVLAIIEPRILPKLQDIIVNHLPTEKAHRADWMRLRTARFLHEFPPWTSRNIAYFALVCIGLYSASRIHASNRKKHLAIAAIIACTFLEITLYSRTWLTFSQRPETENLYNEPAWVGEIRDAAKGGTVVCYYSKDADWLLRNALSTYDITMINSYETVTPPCCKPINPKAFNPDDYAKAGVSLYIAHPEEDTATIEAAGWPCVSTNKSFRLFSNPAFKSRFMVEWSRGKFEPIYPIAQTCNSYIFEFPNGAEAFHAAITYHRSLIVCVDDIENRKMICRDHNGGTLVSLSKSGAGNKTLTIKFYPDIDKYYLKETARELGIIPTNH